jgi:NDP-sugar pyrophosphorylase family protein
MIRHLVAGGIATVYISVGYRAQQIEDHLGDGGQFGCTIRYLREHSEALLGNAGWITLLPEEVKSDIRPLLIVNGDLLSDFPIVDLLERHNEVGADATVCVRHHAYQVPFGILRLEGGSVIQVIEKPVKSWTVNAGIYVLSSWALRSTTNARLLSMVNVINELISQGAEVSIFHLHGMWADIGTLAELERARAHA